MESEFIALVKCREEDEWLCHFIEDIPRWSKPDAYIVIVNLLFIEHKTVCTMVSLDYKRSKDNIANPLTEG